MTTSLPAQRGRLLSRAEWSASGTESEASLDRSTLCATIPSLGEQGGCQSCHDCDPTKFLRQVVAVFDFLERTHSARKVLDFIPSPQDCTVPTK